MGSGAVSPPKPPGRPIPPWARAPLEGGFRFWLGACVQAVVDECVCGSSTVLVWMIAAHDGKLPGLSTGFLYAIEPIGRLGPVS